ncbi:hypothetical protein VTN77DRAFT_8067 [Rasamsonia byssochlamydoides]|uniref:uncharacterized protein n=1 Tax=Rasamsonia byssochlamydoides TaxID=89139 RepID=UPI003742D25F
MSLQHATLLFHGPLCSSSTTVGGVSEVSSLKLSFSPHSCCPKTLLPPFVRHGGDYYNQPAYIQPHWTPPTRQLGQ